MTSHVIVRYAPAMAESFRVVGYGAERGAKPIIDTAVEDVTGEGPDFYAFKALHATGVVCAAVWREGLDLDEPPLVTRCDPGININDVVIAIG